MNETQVPKRKKTINLPIALIDRVLARKKAQNRTFTAQLIYDLNSYYVFLTCKDGEGLTNTIQPDPTE